MVEINMAEQKLKQKLSLLLLHPPESTYASSSGGTYEDTDYFKLEKEILILVKEALPELAKEAGYRLPVGKAPLLTDEQLDSVFIPKMVRSVDWVDLIVYARDVAQAQNDADNKWYAGGVEAGYVHSASEEGSEPTPISNAQSGEGAISNAQSGEGEKAIMKLEDLVVQHFRVSRVGEVVPDSKGKYRASSAELVEKAFTENEPLKGGDAKSVDVQIGKRWYPMKSRKLNKRSGKGGAK